MNHKLEYITYLDLHLTKQFTICDINILNSLKICHIKQKISQIPLSEMKVISCENIISFNFILNSFWICEFYVICVIKKIHFDDYNQNEFSVFTKCSITFIFEFIKNSISTSVCIYMIMNPIYVLYFLNSFKNFSEYVEIIFVGDNV